MKELIFATVVSVVLLQGAVAEICTKKNSFSSFYSYQYCSNGCCGTVYSRYCCSSYRSYSGWSAGGIAGTVVGIVCLLVIIGIIICVVKACNSSGRRRPVVQQFQYPQVYVTSMSTGQPYPAYQPNMVTTSQPTMPPAYQPAMPPAYQPAMPPAYQPSMAPVSQPEMPPAPQPHMPKASQPSTSSPIYDVPDRCDPPPPPPLYTSLDDTAAQPKEQWKTD